MRKSIVFVVLTASLFSCGESVTTDNKTDSLVADTMNVQLRNDPIRTDLLARFPVSSGQTLKVDSLFIMKLLARPGNKLDSSDVSYLSFGWMKNEVLYDWRHTTTGFSEAESDAGTIKNILINDSMSVLLWMINTERGDSLVFNKECWVYGSLLYRDTVQSCIAFGEYSTNGEPGLASWTTTDFIIEETGVIRATLSTNEPETSDVDFGLIGTGFIRTEKFEISIVNNAWAMVEIVEDEMVFR